MEKFNILKIPLFAVIFAAIILLMDYSGVDINIDEMFVVKNIDELNKKIDSAKNNINELNQIIISYENKIKNLKQDIENINNDSLIMYSYIGGLKIICGKTDVRGPGINVRVADNITDDPLYSVNDKIVHDLDVRMIINDLNSAGAEAVAINGKRIVSTTEVICMGPVIRINGEAVAAPFLIRAIGDPEVLLEKAIIAQDSYAYKIKTDYGIDITAMKSYDINISRNSEKLEVNYAKLHEEGE